MNLNYLVPEPEEDLDMEIDFLTPFPIFIESPTLNPCIDRKQAIKDLLSRVEKLDEFDMKLL